jgi:hypothetical protein
MRKICSTWRYTSPGVTFSITNPTFIDPKAQFKRPTTNPISHGTVNHRSMVEYYDTLADI